MWLAGSQTGADDGQSVSTSHCTQLLDCGSQMGVAPGQSELVEQLVPHVWVVPLQIGAAGRQS